MASPAEDYSLVTSLDSTTVWKLAVECIPFIGSSDRIINFAGAHSQLCQVQPNSIIMGPPKPLLRLWGQYSGSQPNEQGRMLARAPRLRLSCRYERKRTLELHADHKNWDEPTPYISLTSFDEALRDLADSRGTRGHQDQRVTVIDPQVRIDRGLPFLHSKEEMEFNGITNPYQEDYYTDHYLCLWEITPAEVVGTVKWNDLRQVTNWYENFIMPALRDFRQNRTEWNVNTLSRRLADSLSPLRSPVERHVVSFSDESDVEAEQYWPSDSEDSYEENENDDIVKMLEDML